MAELRAAAPTMVAVCGDLTQTARDMEFQAARAFIDELPAPVLVVPGNHDLPGWRVWSRFAQPWRRWRRHMGTDPYGRVVQTADGLVAVGVNTARQWGPQPDWSRGRINARQLATTLEAFDETPKADLRVVVAHHPFLLTPMGRRRGLVGRSELALRQLREHADLLLGGHIHLAYSGVVNGLVVAQCGTAFSDRLKGEPHSYNLIEADGDQMTILTRRAGTATASIPSNARTTPPTATSGARSRQLLDARQTRADVTNTLLVAEPRNNAPSLSTALSPDWCSSNGVCG